ncbi:family 78 glycoside hydrolase catalytic domain [candidate division KSB1 bacterium]|nr:family 78 glycoside hydrolase catalytic domain [candidate division KSB1 bacterium]
MNIYYCFSLAVLLSLSGCQLAHKATLTPYDLRCDYLENPLAIDDPTPDLSWKLSSRNVNQKQTAYQIQVAGTIRNLKQGNGDLWDSGKVVSEQNLHVTYAGTPLVSRQKAFWRARVWDEKNRVSEWSAAASCQMGLEAEAWQAKWIGVGEDCCPDSPATAPAPHFRTEFTIDQPVRSARAYASGLGYYELYLNGVKVSEDLLAPAPTNYDRRQLRHLLYRYDDQSSTRVLYNTYDIACYLKEGENAAGMILGNGWYNQRDRRVEGWLWYDTPRFILQLELEYENGDTRLITSDESWKATTGPITHDGIFTGEHYDARLELGSWHSPGYDDSAWQQARAVRPPTGPLQPQLAPPDRAARIVKAVSITHPQEKVFVYDMGEMISGWARLTVSGARGDTIAVDFIEELGESYGQRDLYVIKGDGHETFEPRFTWHAFRHVKVSGASGLSLTDLVGVVVHTAVDMVGRFSCSNELFNKIYDNYIRTQLGNFHGSFSSDCPHRERLGYTGDGQLLVESSIYNFDMTQFYRKWINDMADARNVKTGYVPHTAPFNGGGGGPAWGSAFVIVPWLYYTYYSDLEILRDHYHGMRQWVDYLTTRTDATGLVVREEPNGWCLGDWATPARIELPEPLVNTCYYYHCADILSRVAPLVGREEDVSHYEELKRKSRAALQHVYYDDAVQRYWQGRQGADLFPLAFGMTPEEHSAGVLASLVANVEKNARHLDTGILATPLLLEVLTDKGRPDLAFTIMNQRDFPGFHYILNQGATTLWEEWDGRGSHSHPMYGSVIRWFFKALAGIQPDPAHPGFKHIILKPTPCGDLTFVKALFHSPYGRIRSDWEIKDQFIWDIEIPANTTATVYVPAMDRAQVTFSITEGVRFIRQEDGRAVYTAGSGVYQIRSDIRKSGH